MEYPPPKLALFCIAACEYLNGEIREPFARWFQLLELFYPEDWKEEETK